MIQIVIGCVFIYIIMMLLTVYLGGRMAAKDAYGPGDMFAGFCFIWPIMLPIIIFMGVYNYAKKSHSRPKSTRTWERPHR